MIKVTPVPHISTATSCPTRSIETSLQRHQNNQEQNKIVPVSKPLSALPVVICSPEDSKTLIWTKAFPH